MDGEPNLGLYPLKPRFVVELKGMAEAEVVQAERELRLSIIFKLDNFQEEHRHMTSGTSDKIKGRVKEAVGVVTDNQRLKDEGRTDQAVGKVKKAVERVIDKAKK